jgi:hypothetical protein
MDIQEHIHSLVYNTTLHYNCQLQDLSLLLHNLLSLENNPQRYNCHYLQEQRWDLGYQNNIGNLVVHSIQNN